MDAPPSRAARFCRGGCAHRSEEAIVSAPMRDASPAAASLDQPPRLRAEHEQLGKLLERASAVEPWSPFERAAVLRRLATAAQRTEVARWKIAGLSLAAMMPALFLLLTHS